MAAPRVVGQQSKPPLWPPARGRRPNSATVSAACRGPSISATNVAADSPRGIAVALRSNSARRCVRPGEPTRRRLLLLWDPTLTVTMGASAACGKSERPHCRMERRAPSQGATSAGRGEHPPMEGAWGRTQLVVVGNGEGQRLCPTPFGSCLPGFRRSKRTRTRLWRQFRSHRHQGQGGVDAPRRSRPGALVTPRRQLQQRGLGSTPSPQAQGSCPAHTKLPMVSATTPLAASRTSVWCLRNLLGEGNEARRAPLTQRRAPLVFFACPARGIGGGILGRVIRARAARRRRLGGPRPTSPRPHVGPFRCDQWQTRQY